MMVANNDLSGNGAYGTFQNLPGYGGGGSSQAQGTAPGTAPAAADNSRIASLVIMALLGGF